MGGEADSCGEEQERCASGQQVGSHSGGSRQPCNKWSCTHHRHCDAPPEQISDGLIFLDWIDSLNFSGALQVLFEFWIFGNTVPNFRQLSRTVHPSMSE